MIFQSEDLFFQKLHKGILLYKSQKCLMHGFYILRKDPFHIHLRISMEKSIIMPNLRFNLVLRLVSQSTKVKVILTRN